MRIGTLFSGIGSPEQGASRVYDDLDLVFACEWDKYARESFKANYKIDDKHFHKDIADMDGTQYKGKIDILIGGSPCQDFSLAGLRAGIDGNKGILIYEYIRMIKEVQPPIFIYENVKGMLSDKGGRTIKEFVEAFREMGYHCHYEVLNTKDYGVPQNRERIFLVGFKDTEHYYNFSFAPKMKLEKRLKDVLEDDVDEKYYLSDKNILKLSNSEFNQEKSRLQETNICSTLMARDYKDPKCIKEPNCTPIGTIDIKGNDSIKRVYSQYGLAPTIPTCQGGNQEPKIQVIGNIKSKVNWYVYPRGVNKGGFRLLDVSPTITTSSFEGNNFIEKSYKIRKLTPKECFRLQDFPDSFKFVVSNSQLYKQAGNSISVNMMEMIFDQIEKSRYGNTKKDSLF